MKEEIVRYSDGSMTILKYNPSEYKIVRCFDDGTYSFIRISDGEVLFNISSRVKFMTQYNKNEKNNFYLLHSFSDDNNNLSHYVDNGKDNLRLLGIYSTKTSTIRDCQITDGSYIISFENKDCLLTTDGALQKYEYMKPVKINNKNLVAVNRKVTITPNVEDILTYVIDPETGAIVSNIYSRRKKKIKLYTLEDANNYCLEKNGTLFEVKENEDVNVKLGEITIQAEIVDKLNEYVNQFGDVPEELADDSYVYKLMRK